MTRRPRQADPIATSRVLGVSFSTRVRLILIVLVATLALGAFYLLSYVSSQNDRHAQAVAIRNAQAAEIARNHRDVEALACSLVGIIPVGAQLPAANAARLRAVAAKYHCVVTAGGEVVPAPSTPTGSSGPAASARPSPAGPPASTRASTPQSAVQPSAALSRPRRPSIVSPSRPTAANPPPTSAPASPSASTCVTIAVSVCLPRL